MRNKNIVLFGLFVFMAAQALASRFFDKSEFPNYFMPKKFRNLSWTEVNKLASKEKSEWEAAREAVVTACEKSTASLFNRLTVPLVREGKTKPEMVRYFPHLRAEAKKNKLEVKFMPSYGLVRTAVAFQYFLLYQKATQDGDVDAVKFLDQFAKQKQDIKGYRVRALGSDWDVTVITSQFDEVKALTRQITLGAAEEAEIKEMEDRDVFRAFFYDPDVKDYESQTARSVRQGGLSLDWLGVDLENKKIVEPKAHAGIFGDILSGFLEYLPPETAKVANFVPPGFEAFFKSAAPQEKGVEDEDKQPLRGVRPLLEFPFAQYKDETLLREDLTKLIERLTGGHAMSEKAKKQFAHMMRVRFQGANNRVTRASAGTLEAVLQKVSDLVPTSPYKRNIPEFVDAFPLEGKAKRLGSEYSKLIKVLNDAKALISIDDFIERYTDGGILYHATSSFENAISIIHGGLYVSSLKQGSSWLGRGGYLTRDENFAMSFRGAEGVVIPLTVKRGGTAHIIDWEKAKDIPEIKSLAARATLEQRELFELLAREYGIDAIIPKNEITQAKEQAILLQNVNLLNFPDSLAPLIQAYRSSLSNTQASPSLRLASLFAFSKIREQAVLLKEEGVPEPVDQRKLISEALRVEYLENLTFPKFDTLQSAFKMFDEESKKLKTNGDARTLAKRIQQSILPYKIHFFDGNGGRFSPYFFFKDEVTLAELKQSLKKINSGKLQLAPLAEGNLLARLHELDLIRKALLSLGGSQSLADGLLTQTLETGIQGRETTLLENLPFLPDLMKAFKTLPFSAFLSPSYRNFVENYLLKSEAPELLDLQLKTFIHLFFEVSDVEKLKAILGPESMNSKKAVKLPLRKRKLSAEMKRWVASPAFQEAALSAFARLSEKDFKFSLKLFLDENQEQSVMDIIDFTYPASFLWKTLGFDEVGVLRHALHEGSPSVKAITYKKILLNCAQGTQQPFQREVIKSLENEVEAAFAEESPDRKKEMVSLFLDFEHDLMVESLGLHKAPRELAKEVQALRRRMIPRLLSLFESDQGLDKEDLEKTLFRLIIANPPPYVKKQLTQDLTDYYFAMEGSAYWDIYLPASKHSTSSTIGEGSFLKRAMKTFKKSKVPLERQFEWFENFMESSLNFISGDTSGASLRLLSASNFFYEYEFFGREPKEAVRKALIKLFENSKKLKAVLYQWLTTYPVQEKENQNLFLSIWSKSLREWDEWSSDEKLGKLDFVSDMSESKADPSFKIELATSILTYKKFQKFITSILASYSAGNSPTATQESGTRKAVILNAIRLDRQLPDLRKVSHWNSVMEWIGKLPNLEEFEKELADKCAVVIAREKK